MRSPDPGPDLDLETRELCADGACIGVVGADGRCTECRRTRAEIEAGAPLAAAAEAPIGAAEETAGADFDPDRELCPDGACIGVLGPDRRCKVCGRAA